MAPIVLVGSDVRAYSWTPNGYDGFPNAGGAVSMIGIYKSITLTQDWTRANVKPSSQVYKEKRLTDFDWTLECEHQVRSGGPLAIQQTANAANFIVIFQEESNGNWWTCYGGIARAGYKIVNEERTETLNVENIGTVGTTGYSLFYSPATSGPVSVSQASQLLSGATFNALNGYAP